MDIQEDTTIVEFTSRTTSRNLTGQIFGILTVIGFAGHPPDEKGEYHRFWICRCECGNQRTLQAKELRRMKSCGCRMGRITHGMKGTPLYTIWQRMRQRINDPHDAGYKNYGGRGIKICQGFQDFATFARIIGDRPSNLYSIDRKNNDGHYSCGECPECLTNNWPRNVKWSTRREQSLNTRQNQLVDFKGQTKTISEWAEILGIKYRTLYFRIKRGIPIPEAFQQEIKPNPLRYRTLERKSNSRRRSIR